jgi:hypothetical protein
MEFKRLMVSALAFFELLVAPQFADLIPGGPYNGTLNEFSVMDDVSSRRKIIDVLGNRNILKRRDASCNIEFTPVGRASVREIDTDPIYGATTQCDNEFYQGCLEDFRNDDPAFRDYIMKFFLDAIKVDLDSNAYFGDITRADDPSGIWNWNTFDGIFKKYAQYIAAGVLPASQTLTIPAGPLAPLAAFNLLTAMFAKQDPLLKSLPPTMKAFYVSSAVIDGYMAYLQQIGGAYNIALYQNGIPQLSFNGIPLLPEPTWSPVLQALNGGTEAHAAILTIRGNFIFATDKKYGENTDQGVKSLLVWYSWDQLRWKYAMFMRAGTGIALPQHTVFALTTIA